jgi:hypothetical protein
MKRSPLVGMPSVSRMICSGRTWPGEEGRLTRPVLVERGNNRGCPSLSRPNAARTAAPRLVQPEPPSPWRRWMTWSRRVRVAGTRSGFSRIGTSAKRSTLNILRSSSQPRALTSSARVRLILISRRAGSLARRSSGSAMLPDVSITKSTRSPITGMP